MSIGWVELLILGLATWRLTALVQDERGPFDVVGRLRALLGVAHDAEGRPQLWPETELGRLLACHRCGSVWAALGLVGLYAWAPGVALILALPLALSAIAIGWEVVVNGPR